MASPSSANTEPNVSNPLQSSISPELPPNASSPPLSSWPSSPHYYYNSTVVHSDFSSELSKNPLLTRIGLEPVKRICLITGTSAFWGFVFGGVIGSRQSGMQYLAENAHRLPKNMEGWYFYHKRKNYRMAFGALKKGAIYSAKTGVLVGLFEVLEASADFYRGGADLLNSMVAGVASGALFSVANLSSFLKGSPVWYLPQSLKERSLALKLPAIEKDE
ncbi:hypothetical protein BGX27_005173 [Mortierella sp. AM989]|nr:hypothetical protein BGX27_005173 [Mortierella sp. AM989]